MRLSGEDARRDGFSWPGGRHRAAEPESDVDRYRNAVAELLFDLAPHADRGDTVKAGLLLADRLADPTFTEFLGAVPGGAAGVLARLLSEVHEYAPNHRSSAADLTALVRIVLLAQIDAVWWGDAATFSTDVDVLLASDLIDLERLRRKGKLRFRYRKQALTLPTRAARAAQRRVLPGMTPKTAGLRFTRTRPELVVLLNQMADALRRNAPAGTPPMWVTSLARSDQHQARLKALGYAAVQPSAHCSGYAVDIEVTWYRRYAAHDVLQGVLLDRQARGQVNVIDEGQAWHVCVSPEAVPALAAAYRAEIGG